jgi:hypothetical protein
MLPIALSGSTLQVIGTAIAAVAALASWAAVVVALRSSREAREAERDASRPNLLLSPAYATSGPLAPSMTLAVHNAGSGIAHNVGLILVTEEAFAYHGLGFVVPGETVYFGSEVTADEGHRAVAYGRSADGEGLAWNIPVSAGRSPRRPTISPHMPMPSRPSIPRRSSKRVAR